MNVSIAIPDSSLDDDEKLIDKSRKISIIARACAVFGVSVIYIYKDTGTKNDEYLLSTILRYIETPQFLRRHMFPKINELRYAGVLHPLQTFNHSLTSDSKKIKKNDIRDGVVLYSKQGKYVDVGIGQKIPYYGNQRSRKRILVEFTKGYPELRIKEIDQDVAKEFKSFSVRERGSLYELVSKWDGNIILTSRKGKNITHKQISNYQNSNLLIVFGGTRRGIHDILGPKINNVQNSKIFNFFPNQMTQTVRLDEAIPGVLAIMNIRY